MVAKENLQSKTHRNTSGSMLALIVATTVMLGGVLLFACWYMATSASFTHQQSAIESAALAAAKSVGRIVIDTKDFGYIALCDEAPTGTSTKAADNYFTHVKSLNELMGSARVCSIIADQIDDPFMKQLAEMDRNSVIKVKDELVAAINAALAPGKYGHDINGQKVYPYDEALAYYLKNAGPKTKYVEGSLKLSLGCSKNGIQTAIPLPKPAEYATASGDQQINGFYRSDTNIPYDGRAFVFSAVGAQPSLVSSSQFVKEVPGLPYQMPAVVRVQAQQILQNEGTNSSIIDYEACATSGRVIRSPTPGAIAFSFPDGRISELKRPADVGAWDQMSKTADLLTSTGGDFPVDKPTAYISESPRPWPSPWPGLSAPCREVTSTAIYDWIRAGGATVNVESVKSMMNSNWDLPPPGKITWKARAPQAQPGVTIALNLGLIPAGIQHRYSFNPDGTVAYKSTPLEPQPFIVAGHNQLYAENPGSGGASQTLRSANTTEWRLLIPELYLPLNAGELVPGVLDLVKQLNVVVVGTKYFDLYVRDMLRQPGAQGGKHHGTPLDGKLYVGHKWSENDFGAGGVGAGDGDGGGAGGGNGSGGGGSGGSKGAKPGETPLNAPPNDGGSGVRNQRRGRGLPPMVSAQDDFATTTTEPKTYLGYTTGPGGGSPRPTYTTTGTVADIRFRREIDMGELGLGFIHSVTGYVGETLH